MEHLFYILESTLCCGLFYALYKLFVEGRVAHRFSAWYIILTALLGLIIPALEIPLYPAQNTPEVSSATQILTEPAMGFPTEAAPQTALSAVVESEAQPMEIDYTIILLALYGIIVLLNLLRLAWNWYQVHKIYRSSRLERFRSYTLAISNQIREPFSFGRTVYINSQLQGSERDQVLSHELSHIFHHHTLERVALEITRSLCWFNPFMWLYCSSLSEVHEWEADQDVLSAGYDITEYRKIIFRQLFGYNPDIACGLHNHKTKKRFIMMTKTFKGRSSLLRLCAALPLFAAMIFAFGATAKNPTPSTVEQAPAPDAIEQPTDKDQSTVYISADGKITLNGKLVDIKDLHAMLAKWREQAGVSAVLTIKADNEAKVGILQDVKYAAREAKVFRIQFDSSPKEILEVLPPIDVEAEKINVISDAKIAEHNLLPVFMNSQGQIWTGYPDGKEGVLEIEKLRGIVKQFIDNSEHVDGKRQVKNPHYSDFTWQTIKRNNGEVHYPVSNGVVSIVTTRETRCGAYLQMLSEIHAAFDELREELAQRSFKQTFASLEDFEKKYIMQAIPIKISLQDTYIRK